MASLQPDHDSLEDRAERMRLDILAVLAERVSPPTRMSYQEFLAWADEDTLAEWVDGSVLVTSPASARHQQIVSFLEHVVATFARVHDSGLVLSAPFQMKLSRSGREPDLIFLAREHLARLKPTYLDGPADLAVEIMSPESIGRDRGEKFFEYEGAGIAEYWLIDPATQRAEFYQLDPGGVYMLIALDADGLYSSRALPGFQLPVAWLWRDPLPLPEDASLEIIGDAYAQYLLEHLRRRGYVAGE